MLDVDRCPDSVICNSGYKEWICDRDHVGIRSLHPSYDVNLELGSIARVFGKVKELRSSLKIVNSSITAWNL